MQNNIEKFRNLRGWSQGCLADKIGMSQAHLGRIESGKRPLKDIHLERLAKAFDCSPTDLIAKEEELNKLGFSEPKQKNNFLYAPAPRIQPKVDFSLSIDAIMVAKEALEKEGVNPTQEQVKQLATRLCEVAERENTDVITLELASWLIQIMKMEKK